MANLTTLQSTRGSFVVGKEGHTMKYLALLERRSVHPKASFRNDIKSFIDVICAPNSAHKILSSSDQWKIFSSLQRVTPSVLLGRGAFPTNDKTVSRTMAGNLQYEGLTWTNHFLVLNAGQPCQIRAVQQCTFCHAQSFRGMGRCSLSGRCCRA